MRKSLSLCGFDISAMRHVPGLLKKRREKDKIKRKGRKGCKGVNMGITIRCFGKRKGGLARSIKMSVKGLGIR